MLCDAAAELAASLSQSFETRLDAYKIRLIFRDEDDDSCVLLNDVDVEMAFFDRTKPLKIFTEILDLKSNVFAGPKQESASLLHSTDSERSAKKIEDAEEKSFLVARQLPSPGLGGATGVAILPNETLVHQVALPCETETSSGTEASNGIPREFIRYNRFQAASVETGSQDQQPHLSQRRPFCHGRHTCEYARYFSLVLNCVGAGASGCRVVGL